MRSPRQFSVEGVEVLTVLALVVAVVSLAVAVAAWRRTPSYAGDADALPEDVVGLRQEVAALRAEAAGSFRHLGIVRYDAFATATPAAGCPGRWRCWTTRAAAS